LKTELDHFFYSNTT